MANVTWRVVFQNGVIAEHHDLLEMVINCQLLIDSDDTAISEVGYDIHDNFSNYRIFKPEGFIASEARSSFIGFVGYRLVQGAESAYEYQILLDILNSLASISEAEIREAVADAIEYPEDDLDEIGGDLEDQFFYLMDPDAFLADAGEVLGAVDETDLSGLLEDEE